MPDPGAAPLNLIQLFQLMNLHFSSLMTGSYTPYVLQNGTPGVSDQDKVWFELDANGRPVSTKVFWNGNWRRVYNGMMGEVRGYNGNPGDDFDSTGWGKKMGEYALTQTSQGVPDGQGGFVPGTQLSEADAAKRYNTQAFNDPRYGVSDIFHPGQAMVKVLSDGTRIMVDAAGKAINAVGQGAQDLWSNILNDPRNTDPAYLASIGYEEMGPEGSGFMMPFGVAGPSMGSTDVGTYGAINAGSYFHGGASAGAQHGATSVAGATAGGGGPPVQLSRYTTPGAYNDLRRWMGGRYTTPQSYGATQALAPNPFSSGPASIETPYQTLLSNQQYWGDQFKQRGYILPPTPASPGPQFPGGGRQTLSRGTPPHASP